MSAKNLKLSVALAALLLAGGAAVLGRQQSQPPAAEQAAAEGVVVVEMTAKKYDFTPEEIRVKKGAKVQLKIRALDRTHGFKIKLRPEGADDKSPIGLTFENPQKQWKLEKGQERVIEFVASRSGTYEFECAVFCGLGHRGMDGKLIVEE